MSTALKTECPQCGKVLKVAAEQAGKRVRCPNCRESFEITAVGFTGTDSLAPSRTALETIDEDRPAMHSISSGVPRSIGRFEVRSVLGHGSFGKVLRANDSLLNRDVALKLPRFSSADASMQRRFVIEAKAAANLKHPHIVGVYECGEFNGQPYIVSEFVPGETLSQRLKERQPSLTETVTWVRDLALAMAYAHREGVIHRDLKPGNIILDAENRARILDFGLAKRLGEDQSLTAGTIEGNILGTPAYMSPEQARAELSNVGPASDQYSLGIVLYELLAGRTPFQGPAHQLVAQVASLDVPPPRQFRKDIPADLEAICLKALQRSPDQRYQNCDALATDLDRWLQGRNISAPGVSRWRRAVQSRPRISGIAVLAAIVLVLLLAICVAAAGLVQEYLQHRTLTQPPATSKSAANDGAPQVSQRILLMQAVVGYLLVALAFSSLIFLDVHWEKRIGGKKVLRLVVNAAVWAILSAIFSSILFTTYELDRTLTFAGMMVCGLIVIALRPARLWQRWLSHRPVSASVLGIFAAIPVAFVGGPMWLVGYCGLAGAVVLTVYFVRRKSSMFRILFYASAGCLGGVIVGYLVGDSTIPVRPGSNPFLSDRSIMFAGLGVLLGTMLSLLTERMIRSNSRND